MGKVVLIGGQKGGTGKSTLAINLAALRQSRMEKPLLLVDTDSQSSSANWVYRRNEQGIGGIDYVQLYGNKIKNEVPKSRGKYDDIIIDAGGRDSPELRYSMLVADIMVVPLGYGQFDVETGDRIETLVGKGKELNEGLDCFVIVNRMKNHPKLTDGKEAVEFLKMYDKFNTIDFFIHDRVAFARSAGEGRGVTEITDMQVDKAAKEINNLYKTIYNE